jgi:hypothetical protein
MKYKIVWKSHSGFAVPEELEEEKVKGGFMSVQEAKEYARTHPECWGRPFVIRRDI